jgi:hypothetical protein
MTIKRDSLKDVRQRKYLAKDFSSLRSTILEYARQYYPEKINDFGESGLGGLFLDMASYVGDNMSFYLDHQYGELNIDTAVEQENIENYLRAAGVPITGAAPAIVPVTVFIQVPAENTGNVSSPLVSALPIVQSNTSFLSDNGVEFILLENIDFNKKKSDGRYYAEVRVGQKNQQGIPQTYILAASGLCVSGRQTTETIGINEEFVPFRRLTLSNPDVTEIISISDSYGNTYYKVNALSHDVVYKNVLNTSSDNNIVKDVIKLVPAPYRYTTEVNVSNRKTTLIFGGGTAQTLEDDVIPDPSDFAISFPYVTTFSRLAVNPEQLLQTKTLGVATVNTSLDITYRHGGGLNHNVEKDSITNVQSLRLFFPNDPPTQVASAVRNSIECTNRIKAVGGDQAPSIDDLKSFAPAIRNSQERIVTTPDLLARIYTMPSNFGRVFRAAARPNANNPLASQLFIISRDELGNLIVSPDALKKNIKTYLNSYRMISDAIDILDARVINLKFIFDVLIDPALNRSIVLQNILSKLQTTFDIKNFNIDQPIVISDIVNQIYSTNGIISVNNVKFESVTTDTENRTYSYNQFDVASNTRKGMLFPPQGGIFEIKYPQYDIIGRAAV